MNELGRRLTSPTNELGRRHEPWDWQLVHIFIGWAPEATHWWRMTPYIRVLFFYYYLFWLPPQTGASKIGKLYNNITASNNITHISSNPQYSLRQAKAKQVRQLYRSWHKRNQNQNYSKRKQRTTTTLRCCRWILPSGWRGRRRSCIPARRLVVIPSCPERHGFDQSQIGQPIYLSVTDPNRRI
jgi:hypothetical protein